MADSFFIKLALGSFTATEEAARERVFRELHELVAYFAHDPEIRLWMKSVNMQETRKMLGHAIFKNLHPATEYVVQGLMEADRLAEFEDWWKEYTRLLKRSHAGKEVIVTTARPLTEKSRVALKKVLEKRFNMPVVFTEQIDPEVKGGVKLDSDDWSYDATLKGRLIRLTQELTR
ncbi:ATP synthase F1 subunit delta [Patescibacteria group bacterium]|nr:ATP synthase F1 subunit delta [Patescibacteria group bacterium]